mgnify:CR=1 FL=1|jgi:hypothetical protein
MNWKMNIWGMTALCVMLIAAIGGVVGYQFYGNYRWRVEIGHLTFEAQRLPMVNGASLTDGKLGMSDCYGDEQKVLCRSLTYVYDGDLQERRASMLKFADDAKAKGVYLSSDDGSGARYVDSQVYERDGQRYQVLFVVGAKTSHVTLLIY